MIGIDGNYIFQFAIQKKNNFLLADDLAKFTLIEEAGNVLPTFEFSFATGDESIFSYLHDGNDLKVSFGEDRDNLFDTPLAITKLSSARSGNNKRLVSAIGLYSALKYMNASKVQITESKSAVQVIKDIVSSHFTSNFNITKSSDSQPWIQHGISDRSFVNQLWLHADLGTSFPAVGISSDGKFILKSMSELLKTKPKWNFTPNPKNPATDIVYDGDLMVESNSGFLNSWIGYGRDRTVYNIDTSAEETISSEQVPILALTNEVAKRKDVGKRYGSTLAINDNVHENYWASYDHNLMRLASMGNIRIVLSFHDRFVPIRVLDLVSFTGTEIGGTGASQFYSGQYIVSKVSRTISNGRFSTLVVLCREAFNEVKNT